jgi:hypothetical protein
VGSLSPAQTSKTSIEEQGSPQTRGGGLTAADRNGHANPLRGSDVRRTFEEEPSDSEPYRQVGGRACGRATLVPAGGEDPRTTTLDGRRNGGDNDPRTRYF